MNLCNWSHIPAKTLCYGDYFYFMYYSSVGVTACCFRLFLEGLPAVHIYWLPFCLTAGWKWGTVGHCGYWLGILNRALHMRFKLLLVSKGSTFSPQVSVENLNVGPFAFICHFAYSKLAVRELTIKLYYNQWATIWLLSVNITPFLNVMFNQSVSHRVNVTYIGQFCSQKNNWWGWQLNQILFLWKADVRHWTVKK